MGGSSKGTGGRRPLKYKIDITPTALKMLKGITDRRIRAKLIAKIKTLDSDPDLMGKPLVADLSGLQSVRVTQRYRIIFSVNKEKKTVTVVGAGLRKAGDEKDIYRVIGKLLNSILPKDE